MPDRRHEHLKNYVDITKYQGRSVTLRTAVYVLQLRNDNGQIHEPMGPVVAFCVHWSAVDNPQVVHDGYHAQAGRLVAGGPAAIIKVLDDTQKGQHLWGRNSGIEGHALCAGGSNADEDLVIALGTYLGERCAWKRIDPRSTVRLPKMKANLVTNTITRVPGEWVTVPVIADHCLYAKLDGYWPQRWDVGDPRVNGKPSLLPAIRKQAELVYDELKAGKRKFQYADLHKNVRG